MKIFMIYINLILKTGNNFQKIFIKDIDNLEIENIIRIVRTKSSGIKNARSVVMFRQSQKGGY